MSSRLGQVMSAAEFRARTVELPGPVWGADGSLTLCLPYPPAAIAPNAPRGQSKAAALQKSRLIKRHRLRAKLAVEQALAGGARPGFAGYSLAHFFPTARFRDDDNADGACKAYRDGIADALGVDDRALRKVRLSTLQKDARCPRVAIVLHLAL